MSGWITTLATVCLGGSTVTATAADTPSTVAVTRAVPWAMPRMVEPVSNPTMRPSDVVHVTVRPVSTLPCAS